MSSSIISYIMFTTLPGSAPDWVLEVYVRSEVPGNEPSYSKNIYAINRSGNIDSISPSSETLHTYSTLPVSCKTDAYRMFSFNGQKYYGNSWIHVESCDIDQVVFSNLTEQENNKLVIDIKNAITEVLL